MEMQVLVIVYGADPAVSSENPARVWINQVVAYFTQGCLGPLIVSTIHYASLHSALRFSQMTTRPSSLPLSSFWLHSNSRPLTTGDCRVSFIRTVLLAWRVVRVRLVPSHFTTPRYSTAPPDWISRPLLEHCRPVETRISLVVSSRQSAQPCLRVDAALLYVSIALMVLDSKLN